MRVFAFATGLAVAAMAATSLAAPTRLSDTQFIAANRCLGLMTSKTLGTPDAEALRKVVKDQSWGRDEFIYQKADEARDTAATDAGRNGADLRAKLTAERDGPCQAFLGAPSTAETPAGAHSL